MIKQFRVQNYKALRDVTLDLTPIHVLIGPNDSGKTSILEAIAALCRSVDHNLTKSFLGAWDRRDLVWKKDSTRNVEFDASLTMGDHEPLNYKLVCGFGSQQRECKKVSEILSLLKDFANVTSSRGSASTVYRVIVLNENLYHAETIGESSVSITTALRTVYHSLAGVHYYRWDPRILALPVAPDSSRRFRMESSGFGLALCLDDILGYDRDLFTRMEKRFKQIFPHIKSIKLMPEPAFKAPVDDPGMVPMLGRADGKGLYFEFEQGGQLLSAAQVSDGVLLVLAYLTILHLPQPPRVVLVEEPENGIHPARLKDILGILRDLIEEQSHTQIVLATHSPYIVDLFKPEEVTLCLKEDDGSVSVHRLSESEKVREQMKVFTLGEIWTAEGDEALAGHGIKREEINQ